MTATTAPQQATAAAGDEAAKPPLGGKNQVAALACRTVAAGLAGDPVRGLRHIGGCAGHADRKTDALQCRQVHQVVAHEAGFIQRHLQALGEFVQGCALVGHALQDFGNAQVGGAAADHGRIAAGHECDFDAAFAQQFQAVAVQDVKALERFALGRIPQHAIGQDAVDVEHHQAHTRRAFAHFQRDTG